MRHKVEHYSLDAVNGQTEAPKDRSWRVSCKEFGKWLITLYFIVNRHQVRGVPIACTVLYTPDVSSIAYRQCEIILAHQLKEECFTVFKGTEKSVQAPPVVYLHSVHHIACILKIMKGGIHLVPPAT